jgi:large subunit ribosomal protein L19
MDPIIAEIEKAQVRDDLPKFRPGDTVRVHCRVVEGQRERTQIFEGIVLKTNNKRRRRSLTVRRITAGVGIERTFLADSPRIEKIEVTRRGNVRRARLYYLRDRIGKRATTVKEKR